jgi:flagellar protein FlgJ
MIQNGTLDKASAYVDLQGLHHIKTLGNEKQALEKIAKQFEGIFLNMMLKSMRSANDVFAKDSFLNTQQVKFYQDMLDNELSVSLSNSHGIGLAEVLVKQLDRYVEQGGDVQKQIAMYQSTQHANTSASNHLSESQPRPSTEKTPPSETLAVIENNIVDNSAVENHAVESHAVESNTAVPHTTVINHDDHAHHHAPTTFETPEAFVSYMLPIAEEVAQASGVDPRLLVAQAALETGWGKHQIQHADGSASYNLFGIKANQRWLGEQTTINTTEYIRGTATAVVDQFRAYGSYEESFQDYIAFVQENDRYQEAIHHMNEPVQYIKALQKAGYATDPHYANKVMRIYWSDEIQRATPAMPIAPIENRG